MSDIVKSAGRVMAILETFDAVGRGLRISELVERLQIPQSSASVLVRGLSQQGFLDYDPETRTYLPSARVAMLGTWVLGAPTRSADILSLMRDLNEETGHSVILASQNGLRAQYINFLESTEPVRYSLHPGTMRPIHLASVGIMLLSLKDDDEIRRLLHHANALTSDARDMAVPADVLKMVRSARRNGWFISENLATANASVLSRILPLEGHSKPIAIGLGGLTHVIKANADVLLESLNAKIDAFCRRT